MKNTRLPVWFRQDIPEPQVLEKIRFLKKEGINTVCLEARCPNWLRCFSERSITFMILGDRCTRNCRFCAVKKLDAAKKSSLDKEEPHRILKAIKSFGINFAIITSVTRDDLDDYGASQFVLTIKLIRSYNKDIKIEILIPDFLDQALNQVVLSCPDILAHNIETVPRLYPRVRQRSDYSRCLQVLAQAKEYNPHLITKSSLLLGMGEREQEVVDVMDDLRKVDCDILVLGQYLAPTSRHYPVEEFITIEQFARYRAIALNMGFKSVLSSPLARTSFQAERMFNAIFSSEKYIHQD